MEAQYHLYPMINFSINWEQKSKFLTTVIIKFFKAL
jgi:hypothetical protein